MNIKQENTLIVTIIVAIVIVTLAISLESRREMDQFANACKQKAADLSIRMDQWTAKKNSQAGALDVEGQIEAERLRLVEEINRLQQECIGQLP